MQTLRRTAVAMGLWLTAALAHAAPNLVLDGNFETNFALAWLDSGQYTVGTDITGSPAAHATDVYQDLSVPGVTPIGILSQNISGLTIGHKYTLSFELQRYSSTGNNVVDNEAYVKFGGQTLMDENDITLDWVTKTFVDIIATSTSMLLEFGNTSSDPIFGNQLDNISLIEQASTGPNDPPPGVPEPGTLALLAGGLGLLGATRRRVLRA